MSQEPSTAGPQRRTPRGVQLAVTIAGLGIAIASLTTGVLTLFLEPPNDSDVQIPLKYLPRDPTPVAPPVTEEHPAERFTDEPRGILRAAPELAPPRALADTDVDGDLELSSDGHFRPTPEALRLFRYFQTANGELDSAAVRGRIEAEIDARLPESAAAEARRFLGQYLDYLDATRALGAAGLDVHDLAGRLERVRELQRSSFGDQLAAQLFGPENDAASAALDRLVTRAQPDLDAGQRAEHLAQNEEALPEDAQAARSRARSAIDEAKLAADLRSRGATDDEIRAAREGAVGAEAASRLEDLDQRRDDWEARLAAYRVQRDRVLADRSLGPEQRVDALDRLREERFSGDEVRHVAELDRLDALMPSSSRR